MRSSRFLTDVPERPTSRPSASYEAIGSESGVAEVLGADLILAPGRKALSVSLRFWGAMVLAVVMAGAAGTHLVHAEYPMVALTLALLGLSVYLARTARPRPGVGA